MFILHRNPICSKNWLSFIVYAVREKHQLQIRFKIPRTRHFFFFIPRVVNAFFHNKLRFILIWIKRFHSQVFHAELERSVATLESADVASPSETIAIPNEKSWVLENKLADINERYSRWGGTCLPIFGFHEGISRSGEAFLSAWVFVISFIVVWTEYKAQWKVTSFRRSHGAKNWTCLDLELRMEFKP